MERKPRSPQVAKPVIYLLSPRGGGPYHQLKLISKKLNERGYEARHVSTLREWVKLHFNKSDKIISVVPFLFVRNPQNLVLNIRGNFHREKRFSNPLSYFYNHNLKLADHVIVPSHYLKTELNLTSAQVIPNSTSIKSPPSSKSIVTGRRSHVRQAPLRLATITNFDFRPKAQGITKLINIVNQLQTEQPLEFHIHGGGRWLQYAQQQYQLHNFKKYPVFFHGSFTNAADVLPQNDIFIYWSIFDNMPNVLIEAAACGLPVVVNDYAAYSEIFGPDNLLAANEQQFTDFIKQLVEDPQLRQHYRQRNLERAKLFRIDQNIRDWIDTITT